ncbi:MAG: LLM class flavin-dependent oxidoreductase [Nitrososphaerales archaeon]
MKFGVCVPNYGETSSVEGMRAVAQAAEKLGYDSIWTTDHILMPKNSGTPYEKIFDSVASLAYLAGITNRIRLGISSLVIAMRNPVVVAKQLVSIDSFGGGGRLLLAMSAGWNEKEFTFLGSEYHTRGKRASESIKLIRSLWNGETEFHGKALSADFKDASFDPKPSGQLKIWVGGTSISAMKRAINLGDAWHPNVLPLDNFRDLVAQFRSISPEAKNMDICVRIALNSRTTKSEYIGPRGDKRVLLSGDMAKNREILSELENLGVSHAVLVPSSDGNVGTPDQLESMRAFAGEFLK